MTQFWITQQEICVIITGTELLQISMAGRLYFNVVFNDLTNAENTLLDTSAIKPMPLDMLGVRHTTMMYLTVPFQRDRRTGSGVRIRHLLVFSL